MCSNLIILTQKIINYDIITLNQIILTWGFNMTRINLSIGEKELKELDAIREREKISRSKLIREAIQLYKRECEKKDLENERKERIKNAIKIQDSLKKYSKGWDGVSEIRKWREAR